MDKHEYNNESLGVSFALPKRITIRQHLQIKSRMVMLSSLDDYYMVFWQAIMPVIEDWRCDVIPKPEDLDFNSDDVTISKVIMWVCNTGSGWLNDLESVEKN